jgi:hypothetical protein
MRQQIAVVMCSAVFGLMTISSHAIAQQKTAKECREEWKANKTANQANGITEKAYVAQCRGGASPTAAPAPPPAPASAPPHTPTAATTGQKTAKECREEWKANKTANQANGVSEKAYVAQCRGGASPTAAPAPPPAPAPTAATPPPRPAPPPPPTAAPKPGVPAGANEFSTEAQAKVRCPSDTVVWVNLTSKVYHYSGTKNYGNTKHGAYMCERDTAAAGMRAAKNETHP